MAHRKMRWMWLLLASLTIFAGFLFYRSRERSVMVVRTAPVERHDIHSGVVTNGRAEPMVRQDVRAEGDGEIVRVRVREGDAVRRGQVLVEVSPARVRSELEQARADLVEAESQLLLMQQGGTAVEVRELQAQRDLARREREEAARVVAQNERLVEKGAIARTELDQSKQRLAKAEAELAVLEQKVSGRYSPEEIARAEARAQAARAAVRLAQSRLQASSVAAPLEGIIYSLPARVGDYIRSGDLLARIGALDRIRVQVFVDEPDLGRVRTGQSVLVRWDGLPGKEWKGKVERLPSEIVELGARRVGQVACAVDNPNRELLPNTNLNVEIETESKAAALTIPREALIGGDTNTHVFVVQQASLARRDVKTGILSATRVEILEGLQEGNPVVLAGDQPLQEGMRVRTGE